MSKTFEEICDYALSFDMGVIVKRYINDYDIAPSVAELHERELKRFLTLIASNPGKTYGMKGPVDDLWHTFIIFTKQYFGFCDNTLGRYIHHTPHNPGDKIDPGPYNEFLEDYEKYFGEKPSPRFWPAVGNDPGDCGFCE